MRSVTLLVLINLAVLLQVNSEHLRVGNVDNGVVLLNHTRIKYHWIPFMKRVKNFFYNDPLNRIISGIQALDNKHSKATIIITAGGVGSSSVNLKMKSEKGGGLDYDIYIYTYYQPYQPLYGK